MSPLVSIVLPCYNGSVFLSRSIDSVLAQTYANWELIIVNDCSKDNSLEIMRGYESQDDRIHVVDNERNLKLPASLNKGVSKAHGEYFQFLNSGDSLIGENCLQLVFENDGGEDIIYGMAFCEKYQSRIETAIPGTDGYSLFDFFENPPQHQSSFYRAHLFNDEKYDETYRICADTKFIASQFLIKKRTWRKMNVDIVSYEGGGVSFVEESMCDQERTRAIKELFPIGIDLDYSRCLQNREFQRNSYKAVFLFNKITNKKVGCVIINALFRFFRK